MHLSPLLLLIPAVSPAPAQQPEAFWHHVMPGNWIGRSEFVIEEVAGQPEWFTGASTRVSGPNDYWYALRRDPGNGSWEPSFVSPLRQVGIVSLCLGSLIPGAGNTLALLLRDGSVEFWDPQNKALLGTIATAANQPNAMDLADLNGDGLDELFLIGQNRLWVYDSSGIFLRSVAFGGADVVVAQMDADPQLEIAVASGVVLDGATFGVQFTFNVPYVLKLEAGDFDGDGMAELIVMPPDIFIASFDVDVGINKWNLSNPSALAVRLTDLEGDGAMELLVGQGQADGVRCFDALTAGFRWSVHGAEDGVADVAAADVDGDGDKEILWAGGALTTAEDAALVTDWQSNTHQWRSVHLDGPFVGPVLGDLDGDQVPELVVASSESASHYSAGRILVFDSQTLRLKGLSPPVAGDRSARGIYDLLLHDLDQDGEQEIFVATDHTYDGLIEAYDFSNGTFTLRWTNPQPAPSSASFHSLEAADVDGDGDIELVAGTGRQSSGGSVNEELFYVFDLDTGVQEWRSLETGLPEDLVREIVVTDFNRDGRAEIYGMVEDGPIYVYDGPTKALRQVVPGRFTSMLAPQVGPNLYMVVGDADGWLSAFQSVGGANTLVYRRHLAAEAISGITLSTPGEAWIGSADRLMLVDLASGSVSWQTEDHGESFGRCVAQSASGALPVFTAGRYALIGYR